MLIGGIACLALLALALWAISARTNQALARDWAMQAFESRAQLAVVELARLRESARAGAEALAANPIVEARTPEQRKAQLPTLATILRASPGSSAAYVAWPNGDFLLLRAIAGHSGRFAASGNAAWMAQWIVEGMARFEFLDADLRQIEARSDVDYDLRPLSRPWFLAARARPDTIVTSPYVFFTTREPGLTAARQATTGAIVGVDISLAALSERLSRIGGHSALVSALMDRGGGVLAYGDTERIGEVLDAFSRTADPRRTELPLAEALGSPALTVLAERVRAGHDRFFETARIAGTPWFVLARPIDDQGTTLVMSAPRSAFAPGSQDLARNLLILFATATCLALGLLVLVARQVARPVEAMADEVERLTTLDFKAVGQSSSHVSELSRLGDAVTTMQLALSSYTGILNDAIRLDDIDALVRDVLARLRTLVAGERALYWPCADGRPSGEALHDPASTDGEPPAFALPADLAARICSVESVEEFVADASGAAGNGPRAGLRLRILAIPLRSQDNKVIGAIAVLRREAAPRLSRRALAVANAVSSSVGLVIDRRKLLGQHLTARRQGESILAAVADGIHVLDARGRVTEQNEAARSMLGWTAEEVQGMQSHGLIHHHRPDGSPYPIEECPIHRTLQDGETRVTHGEHFFRKDGRGFVVEYSCSAIRDEAGAITGAVVSFRDVTAWLTAQWRLRERVKELDCLYRVLELTLSSAHNVPDACTEIAGMLPQSLLHEAIASARIRVHGEEYRSPDWQPPARFLRADIYTGMNLSGFVEVGYNVAPPPLPFERADSDEPFLEEERAMLKAVASHIGRMIHTRQIGERLTQTERLTAVGELTGGIAHDFNNLLTVIIGNAELLEDEFAGDPAQAQLARMIRRAAEGGADLTHRLLAFARRQPLAPKTVDAENLIRSMTTLLQRTLGAAIEVDLVVAPGLWPVTIDPVQLESAVLNLAINSRDAMPEGGRLTIELSNVRLDEPYADWNEEVAPGPYVLVAVSDTGKGMSDELRRRAFEPFFTTKEPGKGTGLGLSMVYGFVKQSRGHVRIYSEPGQGTTVKLYLPRAEIAAAVDERGPGGHEPDTGAKATGRILLVEDDDLVRDHTTRLLESMGHAVTTAPNGPFALDLVQKGLEFELLFTDLVMPGGMNGHELAIAVRKTRPDVAVLCTSGYADLAVIRASQLAPDMVFLSKPYRRKELAMKIRQALGRVPDDPMPPETG